MFTRRMFALGVVVTLLCGLAGTEVLANGNRNHLRLRIILDPPPDFAPPGTRGGSAFYISPDFSTRKSSQLYVI